MTCKFAPPLASYIAQVVRGSTMTTDSSELLEQILLRVSWGGELLDSLRRDWTLGQEGLSPGGQHCSGSWEFLADHFCSVPENGGELGGRGPNASSPKCRDVVDSLREEDHHFTRGYFLMELLFSFSAEKSYPKGQDFPIPSPSLK